MNLSLSRLNRLQVSVPKAFSQTPGLSGLPSGQLHPRLPYAAEKGGWPGNLDLAVGLGTDTSHLLHEEEGSMRENGGE